MKLEKLLSNKNYRQVVVIGSHENIKSWKSTAVAVGKMVATRNKILLTGGNFGLPGQARAAALKQGSIVVDINPESAEIKQDNSIQIATGFGLKGRNVILIRSADLVLTLPGRLGTINELTIAIDENKPCFLVNKDLACAKVLNENFSMIVEKILCA